MFLPDDAPAVVAVAGAPVELKGAMFPVGQGPTRVSSYPKTVPTSQPRVSHRLPTAAVVIRGIASVDSPWKTLPAKPGTEPVPQPWELRLSRVPVTASEPARFPRFVHGAGPQSNRGVGRRVGNATRHRRLNGAMFDQTVPPIRHVDQLPGRCYATHKLPSGDIKG